MKKALVRPDRTRVFEVVPGGSEFPVAAPLEWRDCADNVRSETHDFDGVTFVLKPPPPMVVIDLSNVDSLEKTLKALALLMRDYCNQLKLGTYVGTGVDGTKTIAEIKADFAVKYNALP